MVQVGEIRVHVNGRNEITRFCFRFHNVMYSVYFDFLTIIYQCFVSSQCICFAVEVGLCELPAAPGPCTEDLVWRFYYNAVSQRCERFRYGGCGGNRNNFETLKDCENVCDIGADMLGENH